MDVEHEDNAGADIGNDLTTHLMPSIWRASRLAEIKHLHVAWVLMTCYDSQYFLE